ncbi:MAG: acetyl-CoA C-acetyltransferase [Nakamurella sp.]
MTAVVTASSPSVILAGARTPIGKYRGGLSSLSAADLGTAAIKAALERAEVDPARVDYVIMGHVVAAGTGQNPARIAAVNAGVPMSTAAITINKVCLSGIDSIVLADQLIRSGDYDIVVAGGMESMSQAPHVLPSVLTYGDVAMHDALERDGLWDYFSDKSMGELTEDANDIHQVSRADQDAFAALSHRRAAVAAKEGRFDAEIVPVQVLQRRGEPVTISHDEGIRPDTTVETLSRLKPTFRRDGTITAGSSSPISDGAAAVVVTSRAYAEKHGLSWIAEIGAHATVAGPDSTLQLQPSNAIAKACERQGVAPVELDAIEINEAFAAVGIASTRALGVDPEKVNADGGAIAIGHPLGASGTRLVLHLAHTLKDLGGGIGAAALCGGGGQGEALIITVT